MVFFLVLWLVKSILRGLLGKFFGPLQQQAFQQQQRPDSQQTRPGTGNINVNQPPKQSRKDKTSDDFTGGDYIDYEEVD